MKDVLIRQYVNQSNRFIASADRLPELVIDGVVTKLHNVADVSAHFSARDGSRVTVTFIARYEVVDAPLRVRKEEPESSVYDAFDAVKGMTCGCGHPAHPGLVCGYPMPSKYDLFQRDRHCECEG
jgi:hypothetical protein